MPVSYRIWQAPFAKSKFKPVQRHTDLAQVRRVLDVGCGPGTNTKLFTASDYLGIDISAEYVEYATRRHGRRFEVADATDYVAPPGESFDFILVNSFLHHIPDDDVRRLLANLASLLAEDGFIHILELELPPDRSLARLLAQMDRGDHARPRADWVKLLSESFEPVVTEPYPLGRAKVEATTLWRMLYFKGKARSRSTSTPGPR